MRGCNLSFNIKVEITIKQGLSCQKTWLTKPSLGHHKPPLSVAWEVVLDVARTPIVSTQSAKRLSQISAPAREHLGTVTVAKSMVAWHSCCGLLFKSSAVPGARTHLSSRCEAAIRP